MIGSNCFQLSKSGTSTVENLDNSVVASGFGSGVGSISTGWAKPQVPFFSQKKLSSYVLSNFLLVTTYKRLKILVRFVPLVIDHNPGYKS